MNRLLAGCAMAAVLAAAGAVQADEPAPAAAPPAAPRAPAGPPRVIQKVTDDIYRAGNGNWWSLYAVTKDGIILVDPISVDFAKC